MCGCVWLWFRVKSWLSEWVHVMCFRICARGLSAAIRYHNPWVNSLHAGLTQILHSFAEPASLDADRENRPRKGGICVANHTSPIDILILCNDGGYAMVHTQRFTGNSLVLQAKSHFNLNVFTRWVRFMEDWWESSRGQWWGRVLMSGLKEPKWKIAT